MGDNTIRIKSENSFGNTAANGRFPDTPFGRRPPLVSKIDGRARILRPLRPAAMQSNQQPTTSANASGPSGARISSGNIPHSQSMPVLQSGNTANRPSTAGNPAAGRPILTLPSNTTEKHVIALNQWAEVMKSKLEKMRQKSKKALDESMKEHSTMEDLSRAREALSEMGNMYYELNRAAALKCRYNAVFDKRPLYKAVESSIQDLRQKDESAYQLFYKLQEAMDERTVIEKNIIAVSETFRQNAVHAPRVSRLSVPPPLKFSKHVEDANKGVFLAMDAVMNKTRGDLTWRFKRISHPCFRNSKSLIEVHYCARRPNSEKEFVPCMKAVIVLKYGILEDMIIGGEDEDLYNQEQILHSKRKVYREFTKSAKEIILCSPVTKFTAPTNFAQCNNYIQSYVNCFSTKCYYCKKHLRQFMPPTVVTRESSPIICHKLCLMSQVP